MLLFVGIGFFLTFTSLRSIHTTDSNKPAVFLTAGIALLCIGAVAFFLIAIYQNAIPKTVVLPLSPSPIPLKQSMQQSAASVSAIGQFTPQLVQQFALTCKTVLGSQAAACNCILQKVITQYKPQDLARITSATNIPPQLMSDIQSCLRK